MEKISIIINVYNCEKYIKKCLDSIINQTYKNLEILIIDDASKDNTLSIIKSFKDNRIKVIKNKKNLGLSLSRNVGIENASGEYLYFIDADDYIEEDTIEYLYKLIKKYNGKISTCESQDIYDYDFKVINKKEEIKLLPSKEYLKMILLLISRTGTTWNKLYKKELFNDIRFENRPMNDVGTTYKIILNTDKVVYSNQIKYYYFRNIDSITINENKNTLRSIDNYRISLERYNYIKNIYPNLQENNYGLLLIIVMLYLIDDEKLHDFLNSENAKKLFKKIFSIKVLFSKMYFNFKLKILLFKINPKLCLFIYKKYKKVRT